MDQHSYVSTNDDERQKMPQTSGYKPPPSKKSRSRRKGRTSSRTSKRELSSGVSVIQPQVDPLDAVSLDHTTTSFTEATSEMSFDFPYQGNASSHRRLPREATQSERRRSWSPTRPNFFIPGINGTPRCLEEVNKPSPTIFHKTSSNNWTSTRPRTRSPYRRTKYQKQLDQSPTRSTPPTYYSDLFPKTSTFEEDEKVTGEKYSAKCTSVSWRSKTDNDSMPGLSISQQSNSSSRCSRDMTAETLSRRKSDGSRIKPSCVPNQSDGRTFPKHVTDFCKPNPHPLKDGRKIPGSSWSNQTMSSIQGASLPRAA